MSAGGQEPLCHAPAILKCLPVIISAKAVLAHGERPDSLQYPAPCTRGRCAEGTSGGKRKKHRRWRWPRVRADWTCSYGPAWRISALIHRVLAPRAVGRKLDIRCMCFSQVVTAPLDATDHRFYRVIASASSLLKRWDWPGSEAVLPLAIFFSVTPSPVNVGSTCSRRRRAHHLPEEPGCCQNGPCWNNGHS